jgi:phosphate transport system substrate-binding protein
MIKLKRTYLFVLITSILILLISCNIKGQGPGNTIKIKGSYTMFNLGNQWASEFMATHPGISIYVDGGGSATGFKGLFDGDVDIAMASRLIRSEEASELAEKYNSIGLSFLVAKDALSIFLNRQNPVDNLSLEEVRKIFTGEITNWAEVGGNDEAIDVVIRPSTSGTHFYLKEFVLDEAEYTEDAEILPTNSAVVEFVLNHKNAIGYGGIAAEQTVRHCMINGIAATEQNVRNDKYLLTRYLYLYTINTPSGRIKEFIDWVMSPAGQRIVKEVGFVPLWNE